VRSHYAGLPGALQRVAETVLLDPPAVAAGTIVELAERSGTSVSTVTRFCRAIGFEGFGGLRQGLRESHAVAQRTQGGR
jgi:DNA-binding MurR/RpiR family transcriptional regulator